MTMKIKDRLISTETPPLIIAEIGINHGGNLDVAKKMVLAAHHSGCEIIKHQTHIVSDEMTIEAKNIYPPNASKSIWEVIEECSLSLDEEIELKNFTESLDMIYISTPFSRAAANFLNEIGVPAFKIGSGECIHLPLIKHIASFGKPIIMSTGMQSIKNLKESILILDKSGVDYALLQCTNLYPSPPEIVSLLGIKELKDAFPQATIGFSDHSIGPEMALASVALGACIIERHFTDSRYRDGPDISSSMDPTELSYLIQRSKEIHLATKNIKKRTLPEESVYLFARASIVADADLKKGHTIKESDIWARRPGSGDISVEFFYKVIGAKIKRDIKKNEQIFLKDLDGFTK
jgi:sialic acid synthase SpsE